MALLRNGGSALDAVEMAVKVLEDREITNAGYGSNLAADGVVECDAVVVDHHGRSGGVGAVARTNNPYCLLGTLADMITEIRNPVSLARILLDHTAQTLSLRRVPPNLLVGQGATDFAHEHCMPILPFECMISPNAKERWRRWRVDLDRAERNRRMEEGKRYTLSSEPSALDTDDPYNQSNEKEEARKAHTARLMLQNEAQPISPPPSDDSRLPLSPASLDTMSDDDANAAYADTEGRSGLLENTSRNPFANSTQKMPIIQSLDHLGSRAGSDGGLMASRWADQPDEHSTVADASVKTPLRSPRALDASSSSEDSDCTATGLSMPSLKPEQDRRASSVTELDEAVHVPLPKTPAVSKRQSPTPSASTPLDHVKEAPPLPPDMPRTHRRTIKEDKITDTVGAIAIDIHGNIVCAASSGGIGMKHRGRVGPAALVGVGATVVPPDPDDLDRTTVATVTSGTGEHMGTTMAASVCSDRVYHGLRKVPGGSYERCEEDEAISGFIKRDFMGHPSVQQSNSTGAIGILSVKKTRDGAWFYFGHNTDSFALASFHADEAKPVCTISRSKGNGSVAQGGRGIRFGPRRRKA